MGTHMNQDQIEYIDAMLFSICDSLSVNNLMPKNVVEQKKIFLSSNISNPVFAYNKKYDMYKSQIKEIEDTIFPTNSIGLVLKKKSQELINQLNLYLNEESAKFTKYSKLIYGIPSRGLVKKALSILRSCSYNKLNSRRDIGHQEARKILYDVIKNLGFDWKVISKKMIANALVIPTKRTLNIKQNKKFTTNAIQKLISHEIYTHVLRAEFGFKQPYKIFSYGFSGYETTEEGLALFKEVKTGIDVTSSIFARAGRVLAVHLALENNFRDTYNEISKYFQPKYAWNLTLRAKRGMIDTAQKGAFTKDHLYLKGYYEVQNFMTKATKEDIIWLHYGKVGINDICLIKEMKSLTSPLTIIDNWDKELVNKSIMVK
ncbi:MAG: flavohemoglobin expression-modulating QEGLA motif protein [Candidatus Cloacimonetes bacterium]|nr:flavohemoglobin expression-modulating QEGLA motif protein [Candidatus Cloacimonadota bacterium]